MLTGEKVYLRALENEDSQKYYEWINDRDLVQFSGIYRPVPENSHNAWIKNISENTSIIVFSIVRKTDDLLIGTCSLRNIDYVARSAELQIRLGCLDERGKGFGKDSISLLLKHGFDDLNLNRIYLHVFDSNKIAISVYKKSGFVEEGTLRQAQFINGRYVDIKVMSILCGDYFARNS